MNRVDLSLYLIADQGFCRATGIVKVVEAAIAGGVTLVQLRGERSDLRQLLDDALALRAVTRAAGIPFLVNDHLDIALASRADGVHVGQADMPAPFARRLLGKEAIIGLSVTHAGEVEGVDPAIVDYVGLGPVFPTGSKADAAPALGLAGFAAIRRRIALPVVAIGGLSTANAGEVIAAGADGIAVLSAICAAPEPAAAARDLASALREARP